MKTEYFCRCMVPTRLKVKKVFKGKTTFLKLIYLRGSTNEVSTEMSFIESKKIVFSIKFIN